MYSQHLVKVRDGPESWFNIGGKKTATWSKYETWSTHQNHDLSQALCKVAQTKLGTQVEVADMAKIFYYGSNSNKNYLTI